MQYLQLKSHVKHGNVSYYQFYSTAKYFVVIVLVILVFTVTTFKPYFQRRFAIVTLFSENHICEALHACLSYANMSEISSGEIKVVAFFSADVTNSSLQAYRKACSFVDLREMTFDGLPEYVKDLRNYRFKFLMVNNVLSSVDAVMYLDASIVLKPSNQKDSLKKIFNSMFDKFAPAGFRAFQKTLHSNYPVTHEKTYNFFNVTPHDMKATKQIKSGIYVVANSPQGRAVFNSLTRCAIEPDCMAPPGATVKCDYKMIMKNDGINCHRFDQSAMNMRLIELYGTNDTNYLLPTDMIHVQRIEQVHNRIEYRRQCNAFLRN